MNKLKKNNEISTMILSAGRGKRMSYQTKYIAKPLLKIQNQSILKTNIEKHMLEKALLIGTF